MSHGHGLRKNPVLKLILKNIEKNIKTEFIEIQGSKMYLDPGDSLDLSINGVYGGLDTKIIKEQIHEGDVVIDVGANIGYYTLIFAQLVEKSGKVIAFEPKPKNFSSLEKNASINNYNNIILEQKIVFDNAGKTKLFIADSRIVDHNTNANTENQNYVEVESVILDDYLQKLHLESKIHFIKIDVESAELKVLNGSQKVLKNNSNLKIFTEFNREVITKYNLDPKEMLFLLEQYGFKLFLSNYKTNILNPTDNKTLLTSNDLLEENLNLLCKK